MHADMIDTLFQVMIEYYIMLDSPVVQVLLVRHLQLRTMALLYGPCGPSNGIMRVTIDGKEYTSNTYKPFPSDDCLLFQSRSVSPYTYHELEVENLDGRTISVNRIEIIRATTIRSEGSSNTAVEIMVIVLFVIMLSTGVVVLYTAMTRKPTKKVFDESLKPLLR
ncbi:hypothetical protein RhiTH_000351 [Rhizoctonia solani]